MHSSTSLAAAIDLLHSCDDDSCAKLTTLLEETVASAWLG